MEFKEEISLLKGALSITQHQLKGKKDRKRRREKKQKEGDEPEEAAADGSESESGSSTSGEDYEEESPTKEDETGKDSDKTESTPTTPSTSKKSVLGDDMILDILYCIEKSVSTVLLKADMFSLKNIHSTLILPTMR